VAVCDTVFEFANDVAIGDRLVDTVCVTVTRGLAVSVYAIDGVAVLAPLADMVFDESGVCVTYIDPDAVAVGIFSTNRVTVTVYVGEEDGDGDSRVDVLGSSELDGVIDAIDGDKEVLVVMVVDGVAEAIDRLGTPVKLCITLKDPWLGLLDTEGLPVDV